MGIDYTPIRANRLNAMRTDRATAVEHVLSQPDVAFLHTRSGQAGCLQFQVTPTTGT
jgi:hypothetical protein